jgi:alkylhydroperoxidase family enzyme
MSTMQPTAPKPPRVRPLKPEEVRDKGVTAAAMYHAAFTWGQGFEFHNNLIRTIAHCPRLAQTEIDYANSFIFDEDSWLNGVQQAGFLDRLLKEIVITCVAFENKAKYSITHHSFISFSTFKGAGFEKDYVPKFIDLHLPLKEFDEKFGKQSPYTPLESAAIRYTKQVCDNPHGIGDAEVEALRGHLRDYNLKRKARGWNGAELSAEAAERLVDSQLVELTWTAAHFCLLGKWAVALRLDDEGANDPVDFQKMYRETVPAQIQERNAALLSSV